MTWSELTIRKRHAAPLLPEDVWFKNICLNCVFWLVAMFLPGTRLGVAMVTQNCSHLSTTSWRDGAGCATHKVLGGCSGSSLSALGLHPISFPGSPSKWWEIKYAPSSEENVLFEYWPKLHPFTQNYYSPIPTLPLKMGHFPSLNMLKMIRLREPEKESLSRGNRVKSPSWLVLELLIPCPLLWHPVLQLLKLNIHTNNG